MANFTPLDADDTVIPVGAAPIPPVNTPTAPTTGPAPAPTLMDHDDEVIPTGQTSAPVAAPAQADATAHYRSMFADPTITGDQLRAYYKQISGKDVDGHDAQIINNRDIYMAANPGHAGNVQVADQPFTTTDDNKPIDNRPTSTTLGMIEGGHHVLANVAGGVGYLANKIGITNDIGNAVQNYYDSADQAGPYQGSSFGKLLGGALAAAPAALIAAPVTAGAGAIGLGDTAATGLGMFADGASQGLLNTNANSVGGVARDGVIGGTLGVGFGSAAHALGSLASNPTAAATAGRKILDAADRLDVAPLPADVGGALTRGVNAAGEAGLVSNIPISASKSKYLDSLQAVRDGAASSLLPTGVAPRTLDQTADSVLNGAGGLGDYEARSGELGGRLYDQAAALADNTQIQTPRTLATVNGLIEQAQRTPGNTPGYQALVQLRDDLTPTADQIVQPSIFDREFGGQTGPSTIPGNPAQFSVDTLRRLRTSFGDNFDINQRSAREAAKSIWGPLSEDIQEGLRGAGRGDAADAYKLADQHWAQRQQNLDEIVNPILGNRSKEQLADKLSSLSQNDSDLLGRGLDLMAPDQAAHVKASLIGELGRANAGTSNATNDAFSIGKFGTDWNKLSDGVKEHLLNGNEGNQLQDLAVLSQGARDAGRYANHSQTGRVVEAFHRLGQIASGGAGYATLGKSLVGEGLIGGALSSPTVGRGIVRMGEVRPFANSGWALSELGRRTAPNLADGTPNN